jgi:hypothetical protein
VVVECFRNRRKKGWLYIYPSLYYQSTNWYPHPISQFVWQYNVVPARPSSYSLNALPTAIPATVWRRIFGRRGHPPPGPHYSCGHKVLVLALQIAERSDSQSLLIRTTGTLYHQMAQCILPICPTREAKNSRTDDRNKWSECHTAFIEL